MYPLQSVKNILPNQKVGHGGGAPGEEAREWLKAVLSSPAGAGFEEPIE